MWNCPACGTANEPHAIFCASCGAMRYKAPVREPVGPVQSEPLPGPGPPAFEGSRTGFVAGWILTSLAGGFAAWLVASFLSFGWSASVVSRWGELPFQLVMSGSFALVWGSLLGAAQSWHLRRYVRRPGWSGWILATLTAYVVITVAASFLPQTRWSDTSLALRLPWVALVGIAGGGFAGLLQSRVLARQTGSHGWTAWWLVSAGANALGNLAGQAAWEALFDPGNAARFSFVLAGLAHTFADVAVTTTFTGWALASMLRRRCAPPP